MGNNKLSVATTCLEIFATIFAPGMSSFKHVHVVMAFSYLVSEIGYTSTGIQNLLVYIQF